MLQETKMQFMKCNASQIHSDRSQADLEESCRQIALFAKNMLQNNRTLSGNAKNVIFLYDRLTEVTVTQKQVM